MKLRNLIEFIGFKGKPKRYGYETTVCHVEPIGEVTLARWQHPAETPKTISAASVNALSAFIKPGDFAIDIGAHTGDSTLPMALAAGRDGTVLAVEPNPYVYHVLEKNARANRHLCTIVPLFAAATPTQGTMHFEYSDSGFCNGGRHEGISPLAHGHAFSLEVFGVNLAAELESDYADVLPNLAFIKTDCEGFDLYVLQSLATIIDRFRPVIKSEVFSKTNLDQRRSLLEFFSGRNYDVFRVECDHVTRGERITPDVLGKWKHYDVLAIPNTTH